MPIRDRYRTRAVSTHTDTNSHSHAPTDTHQTSARQYETIKTRAEQSKTIPTFSSERPDHESGLGATFYSHFFQLLPTPRHRELRAPMAARTGPTGAATYADCVDSLRNSLKFLEASVETIDRGVSDFPRLVSVLKTVRVCASPCCPNLQSNTLCMIVD